MLGWIIAGAMGCVALGLGVKVFLMRKAAGELARGLREHREVETNTLVDISSRDGAMRRLAAALNEDLAQLREQRRQYQQGDLELKEAVTNISHDLRTPLTAVRGYLDLLEQEGDPALVRKYLKLVGNRVDSMNRLSEELFRYSMAASEEVTLVPVDLSRALEESLVSFYGALQGRGVTPEIALPPGPVLRMLDPDALGRVLSNILSNALKYSTGDLKVALTPEGRATFENSAPGLNPVSAARLFDRFYTIETGRDSTGLGLSIAKLLTERMGGAITATHTDGRLCIELRFPSASASVNAGPNPRESNV